mmetsp:Transcript_141731/g.317473  ORF Transcript_141731/g.317473 Transcript_141731/m.317473 type:complete len:239 (+) Transcript_141731:231-947(+)
MLFDGDVLATLRISLFVFLLFVYSSALGRRRLLPGLVVTGHDSNRGRPHELRLSCVTVKLSRKGPRSRHRRVAGQGPLKARYRRGGCVRFWVGASHPDRRARRRARLRSGRHGARGASGLSERGAVGLSEKCAGGWSGQGAGGLSEKGAGRRAESGARDGWSSLCLGLARCFRHKGRRLGLLLPGIGRRTTTGSLLVAVGVRRLEDDLERFCGERGNCWPRRARQLDAADRGRSRADR